MSSISRHFRKHRLASSLLITAGAIACSSTSPNGAADGTTGAVAEAMTGTSCQALDIAAGAHTTYAIALDGKVYGWGYNGGGDPDKKSQFFPLGHRSTDKAFPLGNKVAVPSYLGVENAKKVVAGADGACALLNDGTVTCWGRRLGEPSTAAAQASAGMYKPEPAKALSLATGDGEVLTGVTAIAYGDKHACALKADGTVWCWGENADGQLGDPEESEGRTNMAIPMFEATNVKQVVAAGSTTCVLRTVGGLGQIACVGSNRSGQLGQGSGGNSGDVPHPHLTPVTLPPGTTFDFVALYGGGSGTFCASTKKVDNQQNTLCWGVNGDGQVGVGNTFGTNSPVPISSNADSFWGQGILNGCEATSTGGLSCWGENNEGKIPGAAQGDVLAKTPIAGVSGALKVAVGMTHVCALTEKTLSCWGGSVDGQVGSGVIDQINIPVSKVRVSVQPPQTLCGSGGLGQTCGPNTNTCGESVDCGGCLGLNSCDPPSHTCKDDPAKCEPVCNSASYCSGHKCLDYCGTLSITDASVGKTLTLTSGSATVTSPESYGNNGCGSFIVKVTNYSPNQQLVVKAPNKPATQAECQTMQLTVAQYGNGKLLTSIGPIVGTWNTNVAVPYCRFDTLTDQGIWTQTSGDSYSDFRVAARLERFQGAGKNGFWVKSAVKVEMFDTCENGRKDPNEAGVDCGGVCGACPVDPDDNDGCPPGRHRCPNGACLTKACPNIPGQDP